MVFYFFFVDLLMEDIQENLIFLFVRSCLTEIKLNAKTLDDPYFLFL